MTRHHLASDTAAHNDVVNEWNRRESYHLIKGELAPCPFCASADLTQRFVSIVSQQMTSAANALIGCKSCACEFCVIGLEETAGYKGAFIAEWNKRHGKKFSAEPIKARQPKALPVTADQLALFA